MASTSKEDNDRVAKQQKANQSEHGRYSVNNGQIRDYSPSGPQRSLQGVANDARRAADLAKQNLGAVAFSPSGVAAANKKLQKDAEDARDAIRKAAAQRKKR